MKTIIMLAFALGISATAFADEMCAGYDAQGHCTGYINTGNGGYTPNVPGMPGNPNNPENVGSCFCGGYNADGECNYYVGTGC